MQSHLYVPQGLVSRQAQLDHGVKRLQRDPDLEIWLHSHGYDTYCDTTTPNEGCTQLTLTDAE